MALTVTSGTNSSLTHLAASLRKQDGVLKLDIEALKSFFLPIDFLFELRWAAGYYGGDKLKGKP